MTTGSSDRNPRAWSAHGEYEPCDTCAWFEERWNPCQCLLTGLLVVYPNDHGCPQHEAREVPR